MKKIISLIMLVILCFSITACGEIESAPTKEKSESQANETVAESKEETFGLNETAVFEDLKFTANEIKESNGTDFFTPESGNTFVGIKFTIENISDETQTVSSLLLFDGYVDDVKCDYSINAACAFDEGTLDGDLSPGKKLVGWYALEVPKNWEKIDLEVQSNWLSNSSAKFVFSK